MESAISKFREKKYLLVYTSKFSNVFKAKVAFLYNKDVGLIELIEYPDK